jgi:hypothetical protein
MVPIASRRLLDCVGLRTGLNGTLVFWQRPVNRIPRLWLIGFHQALKIVQELILILFILRFLRRFFLRFYMSRAILPGGQVISPGCRASLPGPFAKPISCRGLQPIELWAVLPQATRSIGRACFKFAKQTGLD